MNAFLSNGASQRGQCRVHVTWPRAVSGDSRSAAAICAPRGDRCASRASVAVALQPAACRRFTRYLATTGLLISLTAVTPSAQSANESSVKAALIVNFVKFSDWPALTPGAALVLCVFGDTQVAAALEVAIRGQKIDGRGLEALTVPPGAPLPPCQMLFVGGSELSRARAFLERARALPILTVSDGDSFSQSGGIIELYVESGRMRFAINVDAAKRSRLSLSSRLLGLAKIVRDKDP